MEMRERIINGIQERKEDEKKKNERKVQIY